MREWAARGVQSGNCSSWDRSYNVLERGNMRHLIFVLTASALAAQELPIVTDVEYQPLAAQAQRVADTLERTGEPLPPAERQQLNAAKTVQEIQKILDRYCLIGANSNPESRVKVQEGPAPPELMEQGW